jgi:hypothetical protein
MLRDPGTATRDYERWLGRYAPIVAADLRRKHERMRESLFGFFRATFYRWAEHARRRRRSDGRPATTVMAIGDLHVENFGTWRDGEGRLAWGINDFDETCRLPWTEDLVRLLASVLIAIDDSRLGLGRKAAARAVWDGYRDGVRTGGRPFVLEEQHDWLRRIALSDARSPARFWPRLAACTRAPGTVARDVASLLLRPPLDHGTGVRIRHRTAGFGSLGRPRLVAVGESLGGLVAREAKALIPSATHWAAGRRPPLADTAAAYHRVLAAAVRTPDPYLGAEGRWIVRRLGPHCARIELGDLPAARDELRLLHAFGLETANVHLGTPRARARIESELGAIDADWLRARAKQAVTLVTDDWRWWRRHGARAR